MENGDGPTRPLDGIRVLEVGQVISAPYAGLLLADLGAEVIKIEPPVGGDSARNPQVTGIGEHSATFITFNRNKKSIALDLKQSTDYAVFADLARTADVVLTNVVPAVARRLRLDPDTLGELNPSVISCSIQGFRTGDPRADEPSFDLTHQALAGYMLMEGRPGDPPLRISVPLADIASAQFAVNAILAALFARTRTGAGEHIEIPMYDSMLSLLTYTATLYLNTGRQPSRMGSSHEFTAPWRAVAAADGDFVIAVRSEKFWQRLCVAIQQPLLARDPRFDTNEHRLEHSEELSRVLEEVFTTKPVAHWLAVLREAGVPVAPVRTLAAALDEEVATGSDLVQTVPHPELGPLRIIGSPIRFRQLRLAEPSAPPALDGDAAQFRSGRTAVDTAP